MKEFRCLVDQARESIMNKQWDGLHKLMDANFQQRRKLYTGQYCVLSNEKCAPYTHENTVQGEGS